MASRAPSEGRCEERLLIIPVNNTFVHFGVSDDRKIPKRVPRSLRDAEGARREKTEEETGPEKMGEEGRRRGGVDRIRSRREARKVEATRHEDLGRGPREGSGSS